MKRVLRHVLESYVACAVAPLIRGVVASVVVSKRKDRLPDIINGGISNVLTEDVRRMYLQSGPHHLVRRTYVRASPYHRDHGPVLLQFGRLPCTISALERTRVCLVTITMTNKMGGISRRQTALRHSPRDPNQ